MPRSPEDSIGLTPEQRRRQVAAILATGIFRLHCMRQVELSPTPTAAPESDESSLEAPGPSCPDVTGS